MKRIRRTQAERTAETRTVLVDAAITVLHRTGYGGATSAVIAEEAGISRGSIIHHFGTRAQLMADVIGTVYEREHEFYQKQFEEGQGRTLSDWPELLWEVLSKPSGLAVLEILQASRSDPELAGLVAPMQKRIEQLSVATMSDRFGGGNEETTLAMIRLLVWAVRGLSVAQVLVAAPGEIELSIQLLRRMVESAATAGIFASGPAPGITTA